MSICIMQAKIRTHAHQTEKAWELLVLFKKRYGSVGMAVATGTISRGKQIVLRWLLLHVETTTKDVHDTWLKAWLGDTWAKHCPFCMMIPVAILLEHFGGTEIRTQFTYYIYKYEFRQFLRLPVQNRMENFQREGQGVIILAINANPLFQAQIFMGSMAPRATFFQRPLKSYHCWDKELQTSFWIYKPVTSKTEFNFGVQNHNFRLQGVEGLNIQHVALDQ